MTDYIRKPCDCPEGYCPHYDTILTGGLYLQAHALTPMGQVARKLLIAKMNGKDLKPNYGTNPKPPCGSCGQKKR